jgi:hypothetical protein
MNRLHPLFCCSGLIGFVTVSSLSGVAGTISDVPDGSRVDAVDKVNGSATVGASNTLLDFPDTTNTRLDDLEIGLFVSDELQRWFEDPNASYSWVE